MRFHRRERGRPVDLRRRRRSRCMGISIRNRRDMPMGRAMGRREEGIEG